MVNFSCAGSMARISPEQLAKFKALYKKHFNEDLSDQDALAKAISLVRMVELVYKPMTQQEHDKVMKRREELK